MKKITYTVGFLIIALSLLLVFTGCEEKQDECLEFVSNGDGTCDVSGIGTCTLENIVIPEISPEGDRVSGIGNYAFKQCETITSITIPDTVTRIGNYAFYGCASLKSMVIPDSVETLGMGAFYGCVSVTNVTLPSGLTGISEDMFHGCNALRHVTIPDGVTSIGNNAFYGCNSLVGVTLPHAVTSLGKGAFYGCCSISSLVIPEGLTSFGTDAFYQCTGLEKLYIKDLAAWCGSSFYNKASNPLSYAHTLYLQGEAVVDLVIPEEVLEVKSNVFSYCTSIKTVTMFPGLLSIGVGAFYGCSEIEEVRFVGTKEDVKHISVGNSNDYLVDADRVYGVQLPS